MLSKLRAWIGISFVLCFATYTHADNVEPLSLESMCAVLREGGDDSEIKSKILGLSETLTKPVVDESIYSTSIGLLLAKRNNSCSLEELDFIIQYLYPPASQTSMLNRSVRGLLATFNATDGLSSSMSSSLDHIDYLLKLENFPSEELLSKLSKFLEGVMLDASEPFSFRFYAYQFLASTYFLSSEDCPVWTESEQANLDLIDSDNNLSVLSIRPECKEEVFNKLLEVVKSIANTSSVESLGKVVGFFKSRYPSSTDQLKINLMLLRESFVNKKLESVAFPLISRELISELNLSEKGHLLILGQMPLFVYLILAFSFSLPLIIYLLILMLAKLRSSPSEVKKPSQKPKKARGGTRLREVSHASHIDEYSNLLESFGLDDRATEADIKRAYRDLARKFHPDSADDQMRQEFETVQSNYDKLMKLRKGWFGLTR